MTVTPGYDHEHDPVGCFDCMVGGSNPAPTRKHTAQEQGAREVGQGVTGYAALVKKMRAQGMDTSGRDITGFAARAAGRVIEDGQYAFGGAAAADNAAEEAAERAEERQVQPRPDESMSEKQRGYLSSLIRQRGTAMHDSLDLDAIDKWHASKLIDELQRLPYRPAPVAPRPAVSPQVAPQPLPDVPDGRYALELDGEPAKFYRVRHGYRGLGLYAQASDELHPIHNYAHKLKVLTAIAVSPRAAAELYGRLIGRCGVCGRTLTDEESRALGIGPICASMPGWA